MIAYNLYLTARGTQKKALERKEKFYHIFGTFWFDFAIQISSLMKSSSLVIFCSDDSRTLATRSG
jgi:hypothetical protein